MKNNLLNEQPLLNFLESFFGTRNLKQHLSFFEDWFQLVLTDKFSTRHHNPADILCFHDRFVELYEESFKLTESKSVFDGVSLEFSKEFQLPKSNCNLQYLSEEEIINPLQVLVAVFDGYDFAYYKAALRNWLEEALNLGFSDSVGQNIFPLYFNSKKLLEACWLIHRYAKEEKEQHVNDLIHFEQTCPLLLNEPHLSDPYKQIESFFSGASLGEYRKDLKEWFKAALIEHVSAEHSSILYYFHNQIVELMHAGYLIVKNNLPYQRTEPYCSNALTFRDWIIGVKAKTESETGLLTSDYDIYALSNEEKMAPLEYIKQTLNLKRIKEIRYGLDEWMYCALSDKSSLMGIEEKYILELFETIEKLLEAFFLLVAGNVLKTANEEVL